MLQSTHCLSRATFSLYHIMKGSSRSFHEHSHDFPLNCVEPYTQPDFDCVPDVLCTSVACTRSAFLCVVCLPLSRCIRRMCCAMPRCMRRMCCAMDVLGVKKYTGKPSPIYTYSYILFPVNVPLLQSTHRLSHATFNLYHTDFFRIVPLHTI